MSYVGEMRGAMKDMERIDKLLLDEDLTEDERLELEKKRDSYYDDYRDNRSMARDGD